MFISFMFSSPGFYFMMLFLAVFSICFHEFMHAWAALWQGDPTAANHGHLTLNPLVQMGPLSLLVCAVFGIAWGSVPVSPCYLRNRNSELIVSAAGPFSNLLLFFVFCVLGGVAMFKSWPDGAALLVLHGAVLNVVLLLFNMLPLPMLDGGKIFARIFPRLGKMGSEFTNGLTLALLMIFFMSSQHIWRLGYYLAGSGIAAVVFLLGKVFG